jgi:hypothetical protein
MLYISKEISYNLSLASSIGTTLHCNRVEKAAAALLSKKNVLKASLLRVTLEARHLGKEVLKADNTGGKNGSRTGITWRTAAVLLAKD